MGNKNCDKSICIYNILKVILFHLLDCKRWEKSLFSSWMADSSFCKGQDKRLHFILIVSLALAGSESHLIGSPEEWNLPLIHEKATAVIAVRQATHHQERTLEDQVKKVLVVIPLIHSILLKMVSGGLWCWHLAIALRILSISPLFM